MDLKDRIRELSSEYLEEMRDIRRHLHKNPELSFNEVQTSAFVASKLNDWGIENQHPFSKTGVVGLIRGKNPSSRTIALRADLDALPIIETNDVEYKSSNEGVMHACGHDVHTTSLLGASKILNELKDHWEGTIKLIFQPGEERLPGGAKIMIEDGVLENPAPEFIYGQHVYPELPAGKVGMKGGVYMASADEIYIDVIGKGGHAALPQYNVDPIVIASQIIVALQQVVSRKARPDMPSVLSFGSIHGNGATNVIPDKVSLEGTFRTYNEEWRMEAHDHIRSICNSIAESMGGKCDVRIDVGYPFLQNNEPLTDQARSLAIEYLGEENVELIPSRMTAEDFAYFSQNLPGCFYRLGTSSPDGRFKSAVHTSTFDIDEKALETGMGLMAWFAVSGSL